MKKYTCYPHEYSNSARTMILDRPLSRMPYATAGVNVECDGVSLWSYTTCAAEIHENALTVSCLCSNTTRRHVSAFLREYAPRITYQDAKRAYNAGVPIDIRTGELIQ